MVKTFQSLGLYTDESHDYTKLTKISLQGK